MEPPVTVVTPGEGDVVSVPDEVNSSAPPAATTGNPIPRPWPFYFGSEQRPLFGTLHLPSGGWTGSRVLLCPPLGYEAHFAHLTFTDLAATIAQATGSVVMTFDYDGTGDSAGSDDEPDFIGRALSSIAQAIDCLTALPGAPGPLLLIGLRVGAALAAQVAAGRSDVDGVALWAPIGGRAFLREQRVFSQLSDTNPAPPPGYARDLGEQGFEANGCTFDAAAVAALEGIDPKKLGKPPARRVLVLHRADLPAWRKPPEAWAAAAVEEDAAGGYSEMMEPPWLWSSPGEAIGKLADWVRRQSGLGASTQAPLLPAPRDSARMPGGYEERVVWFGPNRRRFGVLTVPPGATRAALFVSSVFSYRIGPNRSNVNLARRLAAAGIASLRIDVTDVGDSRERTGVIPTHPYDEVAIGDALEAIEYLRAAGFKSISAAGICAGAFVCWRAAEESPHPVNAVLANISLFDSRVWTRERHLKWRAGPPPEEKKPGGDAPFGARSRWFLRRAARALKSGGVELALASLPAALRAKGLPARILRLQRRGSRVVLVYSASDAASKRYQYLTSYHRLRFAVTGAVVTRVAHGPDHSFTPRWAQAMLGDIVAEEMAGWTG
jgi:dienelactone hydrolase